MILNKKTGWIEGITHLPSPFFNQRPSSETIDLLIIHNISMPEGQFGTPYIDQMFTGQLDRGSHPDFEKINIEVSCHLLVTRKGDIKQYVSLLDRAWHAGQSSFQGKENCNNYSIGIELEGCDDQPFERCQYEQLRQLVDLLKEHFPAITNKRIVGHCDVAPGRKTDPGDFFDWQQLEESV